MPRHDGCLYEAVIYFIIGGRGRYNPRLGNEAIREECVGRALLSLSSRAAAEIRSEREHPRFMDRAVSLARLRPRIEITLLVKTPVLAARDSTSLSFGKGLFQVSRVEADAFFVACSKTK